MWWCHLLLGVPLVITGLFLFLPWSTALPIALVIAIGTGAIAYYGARALRQPMVTGKAALVGAIGEAVSELGPQGLVKVGGELWVAEASEAIRQGARVQVVQVSGAKVKVRPWSS